MKKIDKEFLLSDSSVNSFGFRLLTSGYQLSEFAKNPIGYYMHNRDAGVLVRWENLRIEGDKVYGKPVINDGNSRGQLTIDEIEKGFLNAASMGHFVVLETSEDLKDMLPGQTGVTVTKWYNRECSLVDVPGNFNALVLCDTKGNQINLASLSNLASFKADAQDKKLSVNYDVDQLLKSAVDNEEVSAEQAAILKQQYKNYPDKLKSLLEEFAVYSMNRLMAMEWDELDRADLLEDLKERNPVGFQIKYRDRYGVAYIGKEAGESEASNKTAIKAIASHAIDSLNLDPDEVADLIFMCNNDPVLLKQRIDNKVLNRVDELTNLSWEELDKKEWLEELKEKNPVSFRSKYKDKFGVDYKEKIR